MLNCEIGIMAKMKQNGAFLRLGDVTDAKMKTDKILYNIHSHLYFLHISNVTMKNGECVSMTNEDNLSEIRKKFSLSVSISFNDKGTIFDGTFDIEWVKLYDITCMQPVFDEEISNLKTLDRCKSVDEKCVIILLPYDSAIKRGTLVESCAQICEKYKPLFLCIDDDNIGSLYKNYLIARGFEDKHVDIIPHSESVLDDILSTLSTVDCLFSEYSAIYMAIDCEYICGLTIFLRKFRERNRTRKLRYVCNSSWMGFAHSQ